MNSESTTSYLSADRPFPGLRPYRTEDQDFFFGREDQIFALYRLFDHARFVAVVGSSGSGKSSLVRAGLLPLLARESGEPTGRSWKMVQMHPGDAPIASLATAMAQSLFPNDEAEITAARRERIRFALRSSSFGMTDALRDLNFSGGSIILVIDQFEELFRYAGRRQGVERLDDAQRQEEATQFVQVLLAASHDRSRNVYILLTMRSDFIGDCANFRGLPEAVSASQFLVPSLTRDQREEAIRRPIEKADAMIEPELVERLLNESGDDIDQLPVLQHCLSRLWEQAGRQQEDAAGQHADRAATVRTAAAARRLTMKDFVAIGGMESALSKHADEVRLELARTGLAVEQLFRSIAEIDGEGRIVRRARLLQELLAETGVPSDDLRAVVDRFRDEDCSFLTPPKSEAPDLNDKTRIDVGHEALLRKWERVSGDPRTGSPYTGWIRSEVADGQTYRGLLSIAESNGGRIPADQIEMRSGWWKQRPRTAAWAERYGGCIAAVEQLFSESWAAVEEETARKEAERAAGRRRSELEVQAVRAREEAEKAQLELAAQSARIRELTALRDARRAWWTAIGVSALLCITVALGVYSYIQRRSAVEQKANVERSLKIGGELTKALLAQVQEYLNTGSVPNSVAKDLLDTAQLNLAKLQDVAQTPAIEVMRANLMLGFADFHSALQDDRNALQYSQQAQKLVNEILADDPENVADQNLLYAADFEIGDAQSDLLNLDASLEAYNAAIAVVQNLHKKDPTNNTWMQDQAFVVNKIGDVFKTRGKNDQALERYQTALAIDQELAHDHPDNVDFQRDLATTLTRIGELQSDSGNLTDALTQLQSALTIRKQLAADSSDASIQSNLSVAYNNVANIFLQQGSIDKARPLYVLSLVIRKNLASADPTNSAWQSYLAFEYVYIGDMRMKEEDFAAAVENYQQSLGPRNGLVARDSKNATWLKNLADSYAKLAGALLAQGNLPDTLAAHKAALALREKVTALVPGSATRQRELIDEYIAIGDILKEQGDIADADTNYQDALSAVDAFVAKHPGMTLLDQARKRIKEKLPALQSKNP